MRLEHPTVNGHLKWIKEDEIHSQTKYHGKIMIGFLTDSHNEVLGVLCYQGHYNHKKERAFGIRGYCCSHFRELTGEERIKYTDYGNESDN